MLKSMINPDSSGKKTILVLGFMLIMLLAMSTGLMATTATQPPLQDTGLAYNASTNPYVVSTLGHLSWLAQNSLSVWDKAYKQTANIYATETQYWDDADDDGDLDLYNDPNALTVTGLNEGFSPIGNNTTKFTGSYNGQNKTIDGLFINRSGTNYIGFFGYTYGATVQNLGLTNVNITGHEFNGGLIGCTYSSCAISNCYTTGSVTGNNYDTGGLVGQNNGSAISNSYSTATVIGIINTGGLVGRNQNGGTISTCYSTGSVTVIYNYHAGNSVGGLIGCHQNEGPTSVMSRLDSRIKSFEFYSCIISSKLPIDYAIF